MGINSPHFRGWEAEALTVQRSRILAAILLALGLVATSVRAFSLLGPYADWMDESIGYRRPGDIGGPMDIGEGYRWNVPELSYSFDESFVDYFGSNGVAAVEQAIQILNDLPPASGIVLTNYAVNSLKVSFPALVRGLFDLKSQTIALLLEQMGLAPPTRNVFTLRRWYPYPPWFDTELRWPAGTIPYYIIRRNYDPETLAPGHYINGTLYTASIYWLSHPGRDWEEIHVEPVDPTGGYPAVADNPFIPTSLGSVKPRTFWAGVFYIGLTPDDVGGLRYLLCASDVAYETLLPNVRGRGRDSPNYVKAALRPGVEKITFVRKDYDSRHGRLTKPWKSRYTDAYIRNGVVVYQELERTATQPDLFFTATNTGEGNSSTPAYIRTGTTNWINNSALIGGATNAGPGVIQPPVSITFHKLGPRVESYDYDSGLQVHELDMAWASFDATNRPVTYPYGPALQGAKSLTLNFRLHDFDVVPIESFVWRLPIPVSGGAVLQTSTNQTDWVSLITLTNEGRVVDWDHYNLGSKRYFRALPQ